MFAMLITEKGGSERREVFDKAEILIGRVQGNDLVLSKGNVSKHHARIMYRDGRFIVSDAKSTNGTYVNGRKITQPTIVRDGDKIYVGDFVLRVDAPPSSFAVPDSSVSSGVRSSRARTSSDPSEPGSDGQSSSSSQPQLGEEPGDSDIDDIVSGHIPGDFVVPGSPRVPRGADPLATFSSAQGDHGVAVTNQPAPEQDVGDTLQGGGNATRIAISHTRTRLASWQGTPIPAASIDPISVSALRLAVVMLVHRIEDTFDLGVLDSSAAAPENLDEQVRHALGDLAPTMRANGQFGAGVDMEQAIQQARYELFGLGALDHLLADDEVVAITIQSNRSLVAQTASGKRKAHPPFATEACCRRAVRRLAAGSATPPLPNDSTIDCFVPPAGTRVVAVLPPAALDGTTASITKPWIPTATIDDLVRANAMSRAMATFLSAVVIARRNIIVASPHGSGLGEIIAALAQCGAAGDRVIVMNSRASALSLAPNITQVVADPTEEGAKVVRTALRLRPDRFVLANFFGSAAIEMLEAIASGAQGVIAGMRAPCVRSGLERIAPELSASRPTLSIETIREWLASAFDLFVEYSTLRDGRARVVRIAEYAGTQGGRVTLRDIFGFTPARVAFGGAIEGSFDPTGIVPRIADELESLGIPVETELFRR